MQLARIRIAEMSQLAEAGRSIPDGTRLRLEQHIQQVLQLCAQMEDTALDRSLLQMREQLQQQDHLIQSLQIHGGQNAETTLSQTQVMLQARLQLVEDGLLDHEIFRQTVHNGYGGTQIYPRSLPAACSTPNGQQRVQATPRAGPDNGAGSRPDANRGDPDPGMTAMPNESGDGSVRNNPGGNDPGGNGAGGADSGGSSPGGPNSGGSGAGGNRP
jgi:uncharacterized membrane protein YgcG